MMLFTAGPRLCADPIVVFLDDRQIARLHRTCFRPKDIGPRAGNFRTWMNARSLFNNQAVRRGFTEQALAVLTRAQRNLYNRGRATISEAVMIDVGRPIGWSSTGRVSDYPPSDLEPFRPNGHSEALRVRLDSGHLAPSTSLITFVCSFRHEYKPRHGTEWSVVIHSLYPGLDIGELRGNITEEEGQVFFPWDHPGVPLDD